jgi:hypothetical protein
LNSFSTDFLFLSTFALVQLIVFGAERFGIFAGIVPAFRYNLISRTPAYKDFHCTRAKRTGEAIGAKVSILFFCNHPKQTIKKPSCSIEQDGSFYLLNFNDEQLFS